MNNISDISYRSAFEETVDAIIITNGSTGKIIDVNKACCYLLGCEKQKIEGQQLTDLFLHEPGKEINIFGGVLPGRLLKTGTGEIIPVDLTINTFNGRTSNLVMTTLRDVREKINYEKQIIDMNRELVQLNASKDKLFSIIAHDLKNPMMALMGLSEILTEESGQITPAEVSEMAHSINKLSKNTYELLDNLLNWAQVQTKKISVDVKEIKLHNVVAKVLDILSPSAELKKVKLLNSVDQDFKINADENMIKTIIRNLVSNGIKFSSADGNISVEAANSKNGCTIAIKDQGVGMEEAFVNNLFKIDVQTSRPGTNNERGTGLGLLICSEFVKLHNGKIEVKSAPWQGTTFYIHLPV